MLALENMYSRKYVFNMYLFIYWYLVLETASHTVCNCLVLTFVLTTVYTFLLLLKDLLL